MKIEVKNLRNEAVGEVELPEAVFDYPYKEHLVHLAVVAVRAGTNQVLLNGRSAKPAQKGRIEIDECHGCGIG